MQQEHRRLVLMRHAKAESHAASDHARRLSEQGRRDARAAGAALARHGDVPSMALVSTARRARDTWEAVSAGLGVEPAGGRPEAWFDRALYDSGPKAVVELLAAVEPEVASVLVVGHNPTMSVVAAALSDGLADPALEDAVSDGLATAGMACFDVPVEWVEVNARTLRLARVDVPRG